MADPAVTVVGAGISGARCCQELRAQGFDGQLRLIGSESEPPYDRPPLSKGRQGASEPALPFDFSELQVQFTPGVRAESVLLDDAGVHVLTDSSGQVSSAALVVATGADPIVPPPWRSVPGLHTLRTRADAQQLWDRAEALGAGARAVIVGGSWIGMEVGSVMADLGLKVTVIEKASWLLPQLPPEVGRIVAGWADSHDVAVRLGQAVDAIDYEPTEGTWQVSASAERDLADMVVIALGVRPATGWLDSSGLALGPHGALRVDAHLRASDPRVVGVGDAVQRWSPRYRTWLPGGHWQDAQDEAPVAAASVLAGIRRPETVSSGGAPNIDDGADSEQSGPKYNAVPYFWSEMFGHTMQWTGYLPDYRAATMVTRGEPKGPQWSIGWLDDRDGLVALLACDRPRDAVTARKAQAADPRGAPTVDPAALDDPDVPLKACLR